MCFSIVGVCTTLSYQIHICTRNTTENCENWEQIDQRYLESRAQLDTYFEQDVVSGDDL